ncbi:MAG: dihydrodipicolinate synthase family protein [Chloroflexi bacterium]|nr:dihydrodipicolinate synthase family protein [Chloroflexota bacterium]
MYRELAGYFPIMPTAYREDGEIDLASMRRLTEYLIENGAQGMSPNGGDSEGRYLKEEERMRSLEVILETNNGRRPVLAGTTAHTVEEAARLTKHAQRAGADAVFVMPTWEAWVSAEKAGGGEAQGMSHDEMLAAYDQIIDGTDIPIMIHAIRGMDLDFMQTMIERFPTVKYIKEETTHGPRLRQYLRELGDKVKIFGPGLHYPAELEWGAMGVMPSCCAPYTHARIFELARMGYHDLARREWNRMLPLVFWRWHTSSQEAGKLYLKHMGVFETTYVRPNFGQLRLDEDDRLEMLKVLEMMGGPPY